MFREKVCVLMLSACLMFSFSGCTTVRSMEAGGSGGGQMRSYDVSYRKAFDLAKQVCTVLNLKIQSENDKQGYIVASHGISPFSFGERIGIYLKEIKAGQTEVRVVSKAKWKTNIFAPQWSDEIHQTMQSLSPGSK